jgi:hypothetical protein
LRGYTLNERRLREKGLEAKRMSDESRVRAVLRREEATRFQKASGL